MYHFFIDRDGEIDGPYSAKDMLSMNLPADAVVTEDFLKGEWYYANSFDFEELSRNELYGDDECNNTDSELREYSTTEDIENNDYESSTEYQEWRENHREKSKKEQKEDNRWDGMAHMIGGIIICAIGVGITILSFESSSSGFFVVKIGAILWGIVEFFKGLSKLISGK